MLHSSKRMAPRWVKRRTFLPLVALFALLTIAYQVLQAASNHPRSTDDALRAIDKWRIDTHQTKLQRDVWTQLAACLEVGKPTNGAPRHKQRDAKWNGISGAPSYKIEMTERSVRLMQTAHKNFLQCSQEVSLEPIYSCGSRGIVTTAGGKYVPLLLVSLRLLRKTGSNLPVEVFLADDSEYEPFFCDVLLPSMNARCRVLSHILSAVKGFKIKSYQFKILSILFSSFEDVLFLDADNIPLNDPDAMFDKHPYQGYGMVCTGSSLKGPEINLLILLSYRSCGLISGERRYAHNSTRYKERNRNRTKTPKGRARQDRSWCRNDCIRIPSYYRATTISTAPSTTTLFCLREVQAKATRRHSQ